MIDLDRPALASPPREPLWHRLENVTVPRWLWFPALLFVAAVVLMAPGPSRIGQVVRPIPLRVTVDVVETEDGAWCLLQIGDQRPQFEHVDSRLACEWVIPADGSQPRLVN